MATGPAEKNTEITPVFPFHGFISYSQVPDKALADALQKGLRSLGAKKYRLRFRALEIFRDETDSAGITGLSEKIQKGIQGSEFLILLANPVNASPRTKLHDNWVQTELETWFAFKHPSQVKPGTRIKDLKIILCLTGGTIAWDKRKNNFSHSADCINLVLRKRYAMQPVWVDLREIKKSEITTPGALSLEFPEFKHKVAEISSQIQGIPVDQLISDDFRYKRIAQFFLYTAAAVLFALAVTAVSFGIQANQSKKQADLQRNRAVAISHQDSLDKVDAQNQRDTAIQYSRQADLSRREALVQRDSAIAMLYASQAYRYAEKDPTLSINYSLKSIGIKDNSVAELALLKAYNTNSWFYSHRWPGAIDGDLSKDGTFAAIIDHRHQLNIVPLQNADNVRPTHYKADHVIILPGGNFLLWTISNARDKGHVYLLDPRLRVLADQRINFYQLQTGGGPDILIPVIVNDGVQMVRLNTGTGAITRENYPLPYVFISQLHYCYNANALAFFNPQADSIKIFFRGGHRLGIAVPLNYSVSSVAMGQDFAAVYLWGQGPGGRQIPPAWGIFNLDGHMPAAPFRIYPLQTGDINGPATVIPPDKRDLLIISSGQGALHIDLATGKESPLKINGPLSPVELATNNQELLTGTETGDVGIYNFQGIKLASLLRSNESDSRINTSRIVIDRSGDKVLTVSSDMTVLWQKPLSPLKYNVYQGGRIPFYIPAANSAVFTAFACNRHTPLATISSDLTRNNIFTSADNNLRVKFNYMGQSDDFLAETSIANKEIIRAGTINGLVYGFATTDMWNRIFLLNPAAAAEIVRNEIKHKRFIQIPVAGINKP